jgi:hypothetical protein
MVVDRGDWEVCEDSAFRGDCRTVRPGQYPSLAAMGLGNQISSIRPVRGSERYAYAPAPVEPPRYDYYPRHDEGCTKPMSSPYAPSVDRPEQRCWVERERVGGYNSNNIAGAVVGGILGGVLGHQIGGGRGQESHGGRRGRRCGDRLQRRGRPGIRGQDARVAETKSSGWQPSYYDDLRLRGLQHRAQLERGARPDGWSTAASLASSLMA